jgi:hypothetical protein
MQTQLLEQVQGNMAAEMAARRSRRPKSTWEPQASRTNSCRPSQVSCLYLGKEMV